jgi:hypothetical protein
MTHDELEVFVKEHAERDEVCKIFIISVLALLTGHGRVEPALEAAILNAAAYNGENDPDRIVDLLKNGK